MLDRLMISGEIITFGRDSNADVRIGHAPVYDNDVPRFWGQLSWSTEQQRLYVLNTARNWGFDIVPNDHGATGRKPVTPGESYSGPYEQFTIEATAPGAKHLVHVVTRAPANPRL